MNTTDRPNPPSARSHRRPTAQQQIGDEDQRGQLQGRGGADKQTAPRGLPARGEVDDHERRDEQIDLTEPDYRREEACADDAAAADEFMAAILSGRRPAHQTE